MVTKKFNELTTGTTLNNTDFIVGYANTSPGGERKWQYSVIRNEISQYLPLSGGTLTDNLNVDGVVSSSGGNSNNWNQAYDIGTAYSLTSSSFLTSETDSQTLTFDEISKDLSISNGNTVSLSALIDMGGTGIDTEIRTLTSTWQDTSTVVQSKSANWDAAYGSAGADLAVRALTANWESTYLTVNSLSSSWGEPSDILPTVTNYLSTQNVLVSSMTITDSLSVVGGINLKLNGDPALYVGFDKVGINTEFPNHELTVVGDISATGSLYGDGSNLTGIVAGDTEATTLVRTNSAQWASNVDTGVRALTSAWESTYTNYSSNSASFVKTTTSVVPGTSAVSMIVAVSALPPTQNPNTLYILI